MSPDEHQRWMLLLNSYSAHEAVRDITAMQLRTILRQLADAQEALRLAFEESCRMRRELAVLKATAHEREYGDDI